MQISTLRQNGILNIYNFVIAITAGLLCDKIGRRPMFLASTIGIYFPTFFIHQIESKISVGMFVFWTAQTACYAVYSETGNQAAAHAFIAMICESNLPNVFSQSHTNDVLLSPLLCFL